jgi:DNA replication initiation complex subunit (GINS family)
LSDDYTLDYDELRRVYRVEMRSPNLTKLNENFYKELKKFLSEEKKKYAEEMQDSFSPTPLKKLNNLKKMIEKIREIRLKKCMNLCLMYSRTNDFQSEGLIDFEIDFAKGIIKLIDKQNEQTDMIYGLTKKQKKESKSSLIKVKFLQSIPAFIGSDMKEYGPYETSQICELPEDVCKILESKKIIEKVD